MGKYSTDCFVPVSCCNHISYYCHKQTLCPRQFQAPLFWWHFRCLQDLHYIHSTIIWTPYLESYMLPYFLYLSFTCPFKSNLVGHKPRESLSCLHPVKILRGEGLVTYVNLVTCMESVGHSPGKYSEARVIITPL